MCYTQAHKEKAASCTASQFSLIVFDEMAFPIGRKFNRKLFLLHRKKKSQAFGPDLFFIELFFDSDFVDEVFPAFWKLDLDVFFRGEGDKKLAFVS